MTMDHTTHPDDERLAAYASGDPEATGDADLRGHLGSCTRCGGIVNEVATLRSVLAELPDLAPPRPLRLLPEQLDVHPRSRPMSDALAALVRRGFGPVLAAGASLALVGMIGTAGTAGVLFQAAGAPAQERVASDAELSPELAPAPGAPDEGSTTADDADGAGRGASGEPAALFGEDGPDRSPWPMVLFTGVALMVAALLLRWILQPRAG